MPSPYTDHIPIQKEFKDTECVKPSDIWADVTIDADTA